VSVSGSASRAASGSRGRRLLQAAIVIGSLSPLLIGGAGIVRGPTAFGGLLAVPRDLDSHFRYLCGIFFATGIGFLSCVPAIERRGARFRLLGGLIMCGGLARAVSLASVGAPGTGHLIGLCVELGVMPALMWWQWRVARRET